MKKLILLTVFAYQFIAATPTLNNEATAESSSPTMTPQVPQKKLNVACIVFDTKIDIKQTLFALNNIAKDPDIKALILMIHNFGGDMATYSAIHDVIKKIRHHKPVVSLVIGSALSAGYFVASASDYIIAHSFSDIGALGIIIELHKHTDSHIQGETTAQLDVELFQAGQFKTMYNPYHQLNDTERDYINQYIDTLYKHLITMVAENRNLDITKSTIWADGKLHLAPEALELGLIDKIGTIFEAEITLIELIAQKNPDFLPNTEIVYKHY